MVELDISPAELEALRSLQSARAAMEALFAGGDLDLLLSMDNRNAGFALANYPALTVPMGYSTAAGRLI